MSVPLHLPPRVRAKIRSAVKASMPLANHDEAELRLLAWILRDLGPARSWKGVKWMWEATPTGPALWAQGFRMRPGIDALEPAPNPGPLCRPPFRLPPELFDAAWQELQSGRDSASFAPLLEKAAKREPTLRAHWRPDGPGQAVPPIVSAYRKGDKTEILSLLEFGVDINQPTITGETALHFAIWQDRFDHAWFLLNLGADPAQLNSKGQSSVHLFCRRLRLRAQSTETVRLLKYFLSLPISTDREGNLPHHLLMFERHSWLDAPLLRLLIDNSSLDLFHRQNNDGKTPMDLFKSWAPVELLQAAQNYQNKAQEVRIREALPITDKSPRARL
jgi:hypothetical protein